MRAFNCIIAVCAALLCPLGVCAGGQRAQGAFQYSDCGMPYSSENLAVFAESKAVSCGADKENGNDNTAHRRLSHFGIAGGLGGNGSYPIEVGAEELEKTSRAKYEAGGGLYAVSEKNLTKQTVGAQAEKTNSQAINLACCENSAAEKSNAKNADEAGGAALQRYSARGDVTHFFTHALVAHPEIGFDRRNEMSVNYDRDCLTPQEFKAILASLYERGYALVDIYSTFNGGGKGAARAAFEFPADKKPLILSFDDINYYVKKMNMGMNDRLDVDASGRFFTYTERAEQKISYDNEVVTILENFIARHPDFSYNGARGVLCLTGFDGVLGYRTQSGSPERKEQTVRAKKAAEVLKAAGWRFACHSYGHYHMKKLSYEKFKADTQKWLDEVSPIVGKTELYVYPYGEWEVKDKDGSDNAKHAFLKSRGFKLFCGVGEREYYSSLDGETLFMDRKPLDGISLRKLKGQYAPYFDAAALYDSRRPTPYPAA